MFTTLFDDSGQIKLTYASAMPVILYPLAPTITAPIPRVVHLHGGEMHSNSDGVTTAWFMPGGPPQGPRYAFEASSLCTYPNPQERTFL